MAVHKHKRTPAEWAAPVVTSLGVLLLLEVGSRTELFPPSVPPVSAVLGELFSALGSSRLWSALFETLTVWLLGTIGAALAGILLGTVIASNAKLQASTRLVIEFLRPIPPVAILPLAVLLAGTGSQMRIYLVIFAAFWPVLYQTIYGIMDVDPVAKDSMIAYGITPLQRFRHLVLPTAGPYIATGLRLAATTALMVAIAAELLVGSSGLGYLINQDRFAGNNTAMYATVVVCALLGLAISFLLREGEKFALFWHPSQRGGTR